MRSQSGSLLIESLVALFVGSIVALGIVALLAQSLRIGTTTTNQMVADQIANATFESIRQYNFATLQSLNGQNLLLKLNRVQGDTSTGPSAEPIPLGVDATSFQWTPLSISNEFTGSATLQLKAGVVANTELAVVVVQWADSTKILTHTATYSSVVNGGGENFWY
jgi:hypothetical protein